MKYVIQIENARTEVMAALAGLGYVQRTYLNVTSGMYDVTSVPLYAGPAQHFVNIVEQIQKEAGEKAKEEGRTVKKKPMIDLFELAKSSPAFKVPVEVNGHLYCPYHADISLEWAGSENSYWCPAITTSGYDEYPCKYRCPGPLHINDEGVLAYGTRGGFTP